MKKTITEKYEANTHLNTLYDVLLALQSIGGKHWYPDDINEAIDELISKISKHIYHGHEDYDVVDETWYSEITFEKNN